MTEDIKNVNNNWYLFFILSGVLIIKIIFAFTLQTQVRSDSMTYHKLSLSILNGEYAIDGKPTAFVVPGYPIFLSIIYYIFGEGQFWVKIIQSLIDVATCYLFYKISLNFFNKKYSLIALAFFGFLPSNLLYSQTILTEPLFGFFSMLVLYRSLKKFSYKNIFLLGIIFGFAILIRSAFSLSIILIPIFLIINRKNLFSSENNSLMVINLLLIFFLGLSLIISSWLIRNKNTLGSFTLATQSGSTFWEGNNPQATGTWNAPMVNSNPLFEMPDEIKRNNEFFNLALDFIIHKPHKFIFLGIKKIGYLLSSERMISMYFINIPTDGKSATEIYRTINPLLLLLINIPYFILMLLGTWGLLALRAKRFFIYGFVIISFVTTFLFVGLDRYHYALIPLFIIGTVNFLNQKKYSLLKLNLSKKIIGTALSLYMIFIWTAELYLIITK